MYTFMLAIEDGINLMVIYWAILILGEVYKKILQFAMATPKPGLNPVSELLMAFLGYSINAKYQTNEHKCFAYVKDNKYSGGSEVITIPPVICIGAPLVYLMFINHFLILVGLIGLGIIILISRSINKGETNNV